MSIAAVLLGAVLSSPFTSYAAPEKFFQDQATQISLAQAPVGDKKPAPAAAVPVKLYSVVDGNKVDPNTLKGWKTWRAQACERCHGASQEGLVGPSLINSLKTLTKEEFVTTVKNGRVDKGMPNFGGVPNVVENLDFLYAYLKGRSDGAIAAGRLEAMAN
jgi:mono/diheme cytochrome c family protein